MQLMRSLLFAMIAVCGCTTMRPVEPGAVGAVLSELRTGDRVAVRTAAGWRENLTVIAVTADGLEARSGADVVTVAPREVLELQIPRHAPGKTVAAALGGFFGFLVLFSGTVD